MFETLQKLHLKIIFFLFFFSFFKTNILKWCIWHSLRKRERLMMKSITHTYNKRGQRKLSKTVSVTIDTIVHPKQWSSCGVFCVIGLRQTLGRVHSARSVGKVFRRTTEMNAPIGQVQVVLPLFKIFASVWCLLNTANTTSVPSGCNKNSAYTTVYGSKAT